MRNFHFTEGILQSKLRLEGDMLQFDEIFPQILRKFLIANEMSFPHCVVGIQSKLNFSLNNYEWKND